jgi:hypothetical protein
MRNSPTLFERRIMACLADRQTLSFNELRSAADAPNDRTLSRTLARLRRRGPHRAPGYTVDAATDVVSAA